MVQHADDEIILQETEKENLNVKNETHENSDDEVDEYELYEIYKLVLDESKLRKHEFDGKMKYINDMKILNIIKHTHNNKLNHIA